MTCAIEDALAGAACFGPFFAVDTAVGTDWQPLSAVVDSPDLLAGRIEATRAALAATAGVNIEVIAPRVAASLAQFGMVARLLSPVLAVAVTHGLVLDTDLGRAHWRPVLGGPYPLSFPAPRPVRTAPASTVDELADLLDRHVMQVSIRRIATTTRRVTPVASGLLWGNVASAVAGAVGQIAGAGPPLAPIAYGLAEALLDRPSLAGTGAFEAGYRFRRRSCCLIYRVGSNAAFCGDCPLSAPGTRRRTPDQG